MSSVRRRPSLFSYFSFSKQAPVATTRYGRSDSVTANLRDKDIDPYEKPDRHTSSGDCSPEMTQSGKWRLFKAVGIVGLIVMALWLLVPEGRRESVEKVIHEHTPHIHTGDSVESVVAENNGGQTASDPSAGTSKCTKSSSSHKPIVQYALMIDAGSTGSRIHVYRFNNCGDIPELESEVFKMTQPGLSSFKEDSEGAAKSLDVLMEEAVNNVPDSLKACTPVAVKATAGLRLLGENLSKKILAEVRHRLETRYPFPVVEGDGVSIMEGKDEGVYAWITTNYLLGKIGKVDKTPTAAVFDLGGASTQIVFEPTFPSTGGGMPETLKDGDHKYELTFGGRSFTLYQHSHLGYGLMEARKSIHQHVYNATKHEVGESFDYTKPIVNPCIAPGMSRRVNVTEGTGLREVNMVGPKSTSATECRGIAEAILNKEAPCTVYPCSFNGIHQPHLERTFAKEDVYIFSYFYDRTAPIGMPEDFTIRELKDVTAKVCTGEKDGGWETFETKKGALAELRDRPEHCLDLNFMVALLHHGYEMPIDRELKIAKKIRGNELGWCLGASLPLLDQGRGGWTCRVREISS